MDAPMEEIVQAVTRQVLAALEQKKMSQEIQNEGKANCLVLGDVDRIPQALKRNVVLLDIDDYQTHQNILRYQRVLVTALEWTDVVDIAQGRPGTPVASAVCLALLQGREVLMLEQALPHRVFAGQGSTALYQVLEGYVNTLQVFGIKLIRATDPLFALKCGEQESKPPIRREISGVPLITEALAIDLARDAQEIALPMGTLITPAAMDVLKASHMTLIWR